MKHLLILLPVLLLVSCASTPSVQQLSADTYIVSKSSAAGVFTNMAKLRSSAIGEANDFARQRGKVAVAVNAREIVPRHGFPSYEYQFRLLDPDDPNAQGGGLEPRADLVIERSDKIDADVKVEHSSETTSDLYTELSKLDDLRKRGIITEDEFQAQKTKLLNRN